MGLAAILGFLWLIGASGQQQPECLHDDACRVGECKVWESSRFVCEPETFAVMVFPAKCILKNELTPETRLEMRFDSNGVLDKSTARVVNTKVEYKVDCEQSHIEIRRRNVN